ncbi:MAG: bifunctional folylpolyglutamate synthase/dihydrofolate synthase [Candidatus Thermoplasmatota archaeon]|nr:bifunctional folylpolyglutamate synthase/dihydrofolate synthase [Candidatus Thermoplasmatota archaeon]
MTEYDEALRWLFKLQRFGVKLGLDNVRELLSHLGDPHEKFRSVHVAGTNGKGSVCTFLSSALKEAGYKVGMYTSPHVVRYNERMQINGEEISNERVMEYVDKIRPIAERMGEDPTKHPTFFELTTAMGFSYFADENVDIAVVEVGMGGRLDATNVITPQVSVITHLALEHTEHLGKTLERIAKEKAGIIKPGVRVVSAEENPVVRKTCEERGCELTVVDEEYAYERISFDTSGQKLWVGKPSREFEIPLLGSYQLQNAATAYAVLDVLRKGEHDVPAEAIRRGFANAKWPARLEVVLKNPTVIIDSSHNPDGLRNLKDALLETTKNDHITFVVGVMSDKDVSSMLEAIAPVAGRIICTKPDYWRAMEPEEIAREAAKSVDEVEVAPNVPEAIERAVSLSDENDVICITGSIFMAGDATQYFNEG